jgi:hypothetical protein
VTYWPLRHSAVDYFYSALWRLGDNNLEGTYSHIPSWTGNIESTNRIPFFSVGSLLVCSVVATVELYRLLGVTTKGFVTTIDEAQRTFPRAPLLVSPLYRRNMRRLDFEARGRTRFSPTLSRL